ncbi:MAG: DNA/RNA nuclease SfsA [Nitrososphaerota archaeon]|jgi:sugar fermentation stimulation protein A|nr:DNA/RNA nuclease SfsA [Nitrososphaerota archaeon]
MLYSNICEGKFLCRSNRFIAQIDLNGIKVIAHVKNTGRCKELLVPNAKVILQKSNSPNRKTQYDLISVWKNNRLINIDSQAPNKVFLEYLQSGRHIEGITLIKSEAKYGNSRFDFYIEAGKRKIFIEVKGVTLEDNDVVMFPDAPTERGVKHLNELIKCVQEGYEAQVVFVIQMNGARYFKPNNKTPPAFGETLITAEKAKVTILALDCIVTKNSITINKTIQAVLEKSN